MSGVYLPIEIPKNCFTDDCPCCDGGNGRCRADKERRYVYGDRPYWCPLVAIPDHGDLIDRQKLLEDNKHLEYPTDCKYRRDRAWAVGFNAGAKHCNEHVYYAKTIISADKEEIKE